MFVNTKFILFYLFFFEFFCSSCERGKIYYHEPIINKVNTGYTNNDERDSNGEQKGNKNNKKGMMIKKGMMSKEETKMTKRREYRGDEQKAASTVPLVESFMRILPNVGNTCYFDSALQVLFRCELVDKKTFSGGKSELEKVYDRLRDFLLNDDCEVPIQYEEMRSILEIINTLEGFGYKLKEEEQEDPRIFFSFFMYNNLVNAYNDNTQLSEVKISDTIFRAEGEEEVFKQQKNVIVNYCRCPMSGNLNMKIETKIKECDEIIFPGNNT